MKKIHLCVLGFCCLFLLGCSDQANNSVAQYDSPFPPDAPLKGNTYASVVITEYANFACPACANYAKILDQVVEELGDQVGLAFAHYVFALHGLSEKQVIAIHNASECARDQGKFWEYHDIVFERQHDNDFGDNKILDYAQELGLDESIFTECTTSLAHKSKILEMKRRGNFYRVNSTPTIFINDTKFKLDPSSQLTPVQQFQKAIEESAK